MTTSDRIVTRHLLLIGLLAGAAERATAQGTPCVPPVGGPLTLIEELDDLSIGTPDRIDLLDDRVFAHDGSQVVVHELQAGLGWVQAGVIPDPAGSSVYSASSVSASGDRVAVGDAYGPTTGPAAGKGQVHVYEFDGAAWVPMGGQITSPAGDEARQFGWKVVLRGDELFVADPAERDTFQFGYEGGSVSVYVWDGAAWALDQRLFPNQFGNNFGDTLDVDGDRLAIAHTDATPTPDHDGIVQMYQRQGGQWVHQQWLAPDVPDPYMDFSENDNVVLSGDRLLVGAQSLGRDALDPPGIYPGGVFTFVDQGGVWVQEAVICADPGSNPRWYGRMADLAGDTIVAGSHLSDLFVYRFQGGQWVQLDGSLPPASAVELSPDGQRLASTDGDGSVFAFEQPVVCQQDLGAQGPGDAQLSVCGDGLAEASDANTLLLTGGPPNAPSYVLASLAGFPDIVKFGGTFVSVAGLLPGFPLVLATDGQGELSFVVPGDPTVIDIVVQAAAVDAGQAQGFAISNAVLLAFGQ